MTTLEAYLSADHKAAILCLYAHKGLTHARAGGWGPNTYSSKARPMDRQERDARFGERHSSDVVADLVALGYADKITGVHIEMARGLYAALDRSVKKGGLACVNGFWTHYHCAVDMTAVEIIGPIPRFVITPRQMNLLTAAQIVRVQGDHGEVDLSDAWHVHRPHFHPHLMARNTAA